MGLVQTEGVRNPKSQPTAVYMTPPKVSCEQAAGRKEIGCAVNNLPYRTSPPPPATAQRTNTLVCLSDSLFFCTYTFSISERTAVELEPKVSNKDV